MDEAIAGLTDTVGELLRFASFPRAEAELVPVVEAVAEQMSRLEAVRALLAAQLDAAGWAKREGATSTAVWLRERCHMTIGSAHRTVVLGKHLASRDALAAAVASGDITADQALVIGDAVVALPRNVGAETRDRAERALLDAAPTLTPAQLHKVGDRILDLVAPEIAEQAEAERLARMDEEANRRREFRISADPAGCSRLSGRLDAEATAILRTALDSLARPLPAEDGTRDPRSAGQRNADALHALCRLVLDNDRLPVHGGTRPHLIITTEFDTLTGLLGAGTLDTGARLPPETVRKLACDAQVIPAVLGSAGELLDLGRTQRLVNAQIRTALIARDQGCTFPGCDRPARWCEAHQPRNDGHFAYVPPPHIDPQQRPRHNTLHMRR